MCGLGARVSWSERKALEAGGEGVNARGVVAGGELSPMLGCRAHGLKERGSGKWVCRPEPHPGASSP